MRPDLSHISKSPPAQPRRSSGGQDPAKDPTLQPNTYHQQKHAPRRAPSPAPVADLAARREVRDGRARWEASAADVTEALLEAGRRPALPGAGPDQAAALPAFMLEAAIAEGERRVYARLGIPQPLPPSPAQVRHLSAVPDPTPELPELEAEP